MRGVPQRQHLRGRAGIRYAPNGTAATGAKRNSLSRWTPEREKVVVAFGNPAPRRSRKVDDFNSELHAKREEPAIWREAWCPVVARFHIPNALVPTTIQLDDGIFVRRVRTSLDEDQAPRRRHRELAGVGMVKRNGASNGLHDVLDDEGRFTARFSFHRVERRRPEIPFPCENQLTGLYKTGIGALVVENIRQSMHHPVRSRETARSTTSA